MFIAQIENTLPYHPKENYLRQNNMQQVKTSVYSQGKNRVNTEGRKKSHKYMKI